MKRLCIIPCGKKKIWDKYPDYGSMEAKDVYISPFGKACQAYATMFLRIGLYYRQKHGFLRPNDIVLENYDLAFNSKSDEIISMEQLKQQMIEKTCFSLMKSFYLQARSIRK